MLAEQALLEPRATYTDAVTTLATCCIPAGQVQKELRRPARGPWNEVQVQALPWLSHISILHAA